MNEGLVSLEKGQGDAPDRGGHHPRGAHPERRRADARVLRHRGAHPAVRGDPRPAADRPAPPGRELLDSLFLALGTLSQLVESLSQPPREAIDVQMVIDRLRSAQSPESATAASAAAKASAALPLPPEPPKAEDPARAHGSPELGTGTLVEAERLDAISSFLTAAISHQNAPGPT